MYQYYRKCHKTHLLLEEQEKIILNNIENISWSNLWKVQNRLKIKKEKINMEIPRPDRGIAVDGFCKGNPGPCGYQGVDIETGEILFGNKNLGLGTNNIAEYLGIIHALMFAKKSSKYERVYSDSEIAIAWIKMKSCGTNFDGSKNPQLIEKIWRAERWLLEQKTYNHVDKWLTQAWGEIPADFGNKNR